MTIHIIDKKDTQWAAVSEYARVCSWDACAWLAVFMEEDYRGKRLSEKLLAAAAGYAKAIGFHEIYLTTWHQGLYEKYGFAKIYEKEVREGYSEGIYRKVTAD